MQNIDGPSSVNESVANTSRRFLPKKPFSQRRTGSNFDNNVGEICIYPAKYQFRKYNLIVNATLFWSTLWNFAPEKKKNANSTPGPASVCVFRPVQCLIEVAGEARSFNFSQFARITKASGSFSAETFSVLVPGGVIYLKHLKWRESSTVVLTGVLHGHWSFWRRSVCGGGLWQN